MAGSCLWPSRTAACGTPDLIAEGVDLLQTALARDRLGEYQAQAAIAALHADARRARGDRLGADRRVVRRTGSPHRQPGGPPQPGGRGRRGQRTAGRVWPPWPGSTPPCPATPPLRRTSTSAMVTRSLQRGSTPKRPDRRPTSPNAITSRDRPHDSTSGRAIQRRPARTDQATVLRAAGGRGAPVTAERCGDGRVAESGWAMSSRDFCSASTPRKAATSPPPTITPAPMR